MDVKAVLNLAYSNEETGASCAKLVLPHLTETLILSDHLSWRCKTWSSQTFLFLYSKRLT